jgi:O-antigen/teichoic acid export membrane protein
MRRENKLFSAKSTISRLKSRGAAAHDWNNVITTITKKLVTGSAIRVMNFGIQIVVAFFMTPFIVSTLGDRMYGSWLLVATFLGYYGLLDLGLSSAVNRYLAGAAGEKDAAGSNRIFNTAVFLYSALGCLALIVTGIFIILTPYIIKSPEDASLFRKIILIMGVSSAISFPIRAFMAVLTAQLRFDIMSSLQIMTVIIRTLAIVLALTAGHKILSMAVITFFAGLPELVITVYYARKNYPSLSIFDRAYWNRDTAKMLLSYSFFTLISQLGDLFRFNIDALIITTFIGLAAVTHYGIAAALGIYYLNLMMAFMGVLQPVFSRQYSLSDSAVIKKTFFFTTKISFFAASFPAFCYFALGKPFIIRWMGDSFVDSYPCLVILTLAWLFDLGQMPSVGLLYGISKHKFYALFNTIEGIFNVVLSVILVGKMGIIGVALGTLIPMSIMKIIIQPIYICRVASIPYREYMGMIFRTTAIILGSLIIPLIVSLKYATPNYGNLVMFVSGSALYYALIIWMAGFYPQERDVLKSIVLHRSLKAQEPIFIAMTDIEK